MISSLTGPVGALGPGWAQIVVGGIGFRVEIPGAAVMPPGSGEVTLHTSLIVREDSLTLFGFLTAADRDGFDVLLGVSGIGPRLALAAIDTLGLDALRAAVSQADLATLQKIPGVGKKTAQRMLLEIGDKLGASTLSAEATAPLSKTEDMRLAVQDALEQLGWPRPVAQKTLDDLTGEFTSTEDLLRAALVTLGGPRGI